MSNNYIIEPWNKLEELVSLNQFELLLNRRKPPFSEDEKENDAGASDLWLVYLMNDAAESFLIFKNAILTGDYIEDFEGDIRIDYKTADDGEKEYVILHQEENVVTIFFDRLEQKTFLFDYSHVGHFWVEGQEYLRQLEYKFTVVRNKLDYLGESSCSEIEKKLAALRDFPPLSYLFYSAVPEKYIVPLDDPWKPSREAIAVMREISLDAGAPEFARWVSLYGWIATKQMGKILAAKLREKKNVCIARTLMQYFEEGCKAYTARYEIGHQENIPEFERIYRKVSTAKGGEYFVEEPFWFAGDGIGGKVYIAKWDESGREAKMRITELP